MANPYYNLPGVSENELLYDDDILKHGSFEHDEKPFFFLRGCPLILLDNPILLKQSHFLPLPSGTVSYGIPLLWVHVWGVSSVLSYLNYAWCMALLHFHYCLLSHLMSTPKK